MYQQNKKEANLDKESVPKTKQKKSEKKSFEENMNKLEQVSHELGKGNENLESMVLLFEEGIKLAEICNKMLDDAEQRVDILVKGPGEDEIKTQKFQIQE